MKLLFLSILLSFAFIGLAISMSAAPVLAQSETAECEQLRKQFEDAGAGGLVKSLPAYCDTNPFFGIYNKVSTFLYTILGAVAVIALIYGGYIYMTAGSNESARKKGQEIIMYTVIGIVIVVLAVTIVTLVSKFVVDNSLF